MAIETMMMVAKSGLAFLRAFLAWTVMPHGRSFRKGLWTLGIAQQPGTEQNRHGRESILQRNSNRRVSVLRGRIYGCPPGGWRNKSPVSEQVMISSSLSWCPGSAARVFIYRPNPFWIWFSNGFPWVRWANSAQVTKKYVTYVFLWNVLYTQQVFLAGWWNFYLDKNNYLMLTLAQSHVKIHPS